MNRFRVAPDEAEGFRARAQAALDALAQRAGYLTGHLGRNVDEPELWVLATTWDGPGSYRRALSSYDVKLTVVPLLSAALDEPSAYELVDRDPGVALNRAVPRGEPR